MYVHYSIDYFRGSIYTSPPPPPPPPKGLGTRLRLILNKYIQLHVKVHCKKSLCVFNSRHTHTHTHTHTHSGMSPRGSGGSSLTGSRAGSKASSRASSRPPFLPRQFLHSLAGQITDILSSKQCFQQCKTSP